MALIYRLPGQDGGAAYQWPSRRTSRVRSRSRRDGSDLRISARVVPLDAAEAHPGPTADREADRRDGRWANGRRAAL